ncbi:MAG: hypothetical protein QW303_08235 [Nitrososphaerota archaeon]
MVLFPVPGTVPTISLVPGIVPAVPSVPGIVPTISRDVSKKICYWFQIMKIWLIENINRVKREMIN